MAVGSLPPLRQLVQVFPPECYERPVWLGVAYLVRATLLYALTLWGLWSSDHPVVLLALWPLAGLAISGLFVLAHDAAHNALFDSQRLNAWVARFALLPTLHAASPWILGHNRIHHVYTNRAGYDFVWQPLSPVQFAALSPWQRWRHRFEWSVAGMGLYYLRCIWWQRMMRYPAPSRFAATFRADRWLVVAYAIVWSSLVAWLGFGTSGTSGAVWSWCKLGLVPWLWWNYFIAATVFVQHASPTSPWFEATVWRRNRAQMEASSNYRVPRWYNLFAHNIYVHQPHHIDPRIPFYRLPAALAALAAAYPGSVRIEALTANRFLAVVRRCKLYDFDRAQWTGYPVAARSGAATAR